MGKTHQEISELLDIPRRTVSDVIGRKRNSSETAKTEPEPEEETEHSEEGEPNVFSNKLLMLYKMTVYLYSGKLKKLFKMERCRI